MKCTYIYHGELEGQQCKRSAVYGTNVCVRHGGGKPLQGKPQGHQNFKTGANSKYPLLRFAGQIIEGKVPDTRRYEKFIPERLTGKYIESVNDPDIIALNDDIALVETRIKQILANMDKDEPSSVWIDAYNVFREFMMYKRLGDKIKMTESLALLEDMFETNHKEREGWDEVFDRLEQIAKLRESERKRRMDMKNLLDAEKAMDLVSRLLAAVNEAAEDVIENEQKRKELYLATGQRFIRITGSGDRSVLEAIESGTDSLARPSELD